MTVRIAIHNDNDYSAVLFKPTCPAMGRYYFSAELYKKPDGLICDISENVFYTVRNEEVNISNSKQPIPQRLYTEISKLIGLKKVNITIMKLEEKLTVCITEKT